MARLLNIIFFLYFLSHIPITILFDSQVVFSNANPMYPSIVRDMVKNYSESFKDPMILDPPIWFKAFCVCEIFLQFPFFFLCSLGFLER